MRRKYLEEIQCEFYKVKTGGLFHIFGSSVISQMGGLISSFLVIRHLSKMDYGNYVSANNLYSYIAVFAGLGMTSAILQFCSEHVPSERKAAIYRYSFLQGSIFNLVLALAILLLAFYKSKTGYSESAYYLSLMCGFPFITYISIFSQTVLRILRMNQEFARVNMLGTFFKIFGNIFFTRFLGVSGLVLSTYVAEIFAAGLGIAILQKINFLSPILTSAQSLPPNNKKVITKYAVLCAITNFTSTMLVLLDITCLDFTLSDPNLLADYKVAATLPTACIFIPAGLITYFYPQMVESFSSGIDEFKRYFQQLMKMFFCINFVAFLGLILFAPLLITLLYGEKYTNVVSIFRVLCFNFLITATVRKLLGNMICVVKAVRVNLIHTIIAGILNVVLDLILIQKIGSIGAAIATTCVTAFVAILELLFFKRFFRRNSRRANPDAK